MRNDTGVRQRAHEPELSDKTLEHGRRREGISWSFLTWAFFLSQSVAAEQALAAAARPADESADQLLRTPTVREAGVPTNQRTPDISGHSATETGGGSIGQTHTAGALDLASRLGAVHAQDAEWRDVEHGLARQMASASGGTASQGHTIQRPLADIAIVTPAADLPTLPGRNPIGDVVEGVVEPVIGIVDGVLDAVLDPLVPVAGEVMQPVLDVVGAITSPIIGVVDDALTTVLPLLNNVVPPIVGSLESITDATGPAFDSATQLGSIVGNVAAALQPEMAETLAPLEKLAGSVAAALSEFEPVLDGAVSFSDTGEEITSDVEDAVEPLVGQTPGSAIDLPGALAAKAAEAAGSALEDMSAPLAEAISTAGPDGTAAFVDATSQADAPLLAYAGLSAGDTIDLGHAAGTPALELFSGGSYTDYALALTSDARTDDSALSGNANADDPVAVPTLTDGMPEDTRTQPIDALLAESAADRVFQGFGF